ncbi:hypothetical protein [Desertibacillus haloalkaliphilus]|uniref:hypothetical protein n=1 Tax=Desertibacillus haloalkaliphilus TaxID=1328930 RepID=UPI001C25ABD7|nr:hypothetical protein [Desertibacillus haloalkaliphilus]MBU8906165.1 hypothetical protein [Desertibacillus haloalkaliphilus]
MGIIKVAFFVVISLLLISCQSEHDQTSFQDNGDREHEWENEYYLWTEKLYGNGQLIKTMVPYLQDGNYKEASALVKGFNIGRERYNLYEQLDREVYSYLEQYYGEEVVQSLIEVDDNLVRTTHELPNFLNQDSKEYHEEVLTLLKEINTNYFSIGGINKTVTNRDLSLYHIYTYPYQMTDEHNLNEIKQLTNEVKNQTEDLLDLLEKF